MHRFFVPPGCIDEDAAVLTGAVARQLATVLRAAPGERIALLDDSGWEYRVTLSSVTSREVLGAVRP
jgi:16S rRNA U1498 N3-methylase RsmE